MSLFLAQAEPATALACEHLQVDFGLLLNCSISSCSKSPPVSPLLQLIISTQKVFYHSEAEANLSKHQGLLNTTVDSISSPSTVWPRAVGPQRLPQARKQTPAQLQSLLCTAGTVCLTFFQLQYIHPLWMGQMRSVVAAFTQVFFSMFSWKVETCFCWYILIKVVEIFSVKSIFLHCPW